MKVDIFMSLTFLFETENRLGCFLSWCNKINISVAGIAARVALTGTFGLNLGTLFYYKFHHCFSVWNNHWVRQVYEKSGCNLNSVWHICVFFLPIFHVNLHLPSHDQCLHNIRSTHCLHEHIREDISHSKLFDSQGCKHAHITKLETNYIHTKIVKLYSDAVITVPEYL